MKRLVIAFVLFFTGQFLNAQNLQSPGDFLGYELGSKFTPHYKLAAYFNYAATENPKMLRIEKYGETNEGRPLFIAIVSSPENMANLEYIRKNNLRLTGLMDDSTGSEEAPAIVWLSYNVHGNEPDCSEAAMKVLYELLNPINLQTKAWLKNIVVIIDPCVNPDGRDRYVNWITQMTGQEPDVDPDAREHNEPWPGGRTNHYNFDLNRDWAWQTQVESRQRVKKYNEWMPQVHCDFHEQEIDQPYYFAPAAEPLHEVITSWQKEFQKIIAQNHARYFDAHGWLYVTKEVFDLFYPAYGDTYPMYNGAIGMTYEEAGNAAAGVAVLKSDGDTLTLKDRIDHHYTTSISTIESASLYAGDLVKQFKKYFDLARREGVGEFKSYVLKTSDASPSQIIALKKLLDANEIRYAYCQKQTASGYNYFTQQVETFSTETGDLVLKNKQPKSVLLKVLFEPKSKLSDSLTYDITAWSVPYAYGIPAYAVKDKMIAVQKEKTAEGKNAVPFYDSSGIAFIYPEKGFTSSKILAFLLKNKIKVRVADSGFSFGGKDYSQGSLLIIKSENNEPDKNLKEIFYRVYNELGAFPSMIPAGYNDKGLNLGSQLFRLVKKPNIVLLTGPGIVPEAAGELWFLFDRELGFPVKLANANKIGSLDFKNTDVIIMPDGDYDFLNDSSLNNTVKAWVKQGGKLIALEKATEDLSKGNWGIGLNTPGLPTDSSEHLFANKERDDLSQSVSGAIFKVHLDNTHPLAYGYPDYYFTLKRNNTVFKTSKDCWPVGTLNKNSLLSGFVGSKIKPVLKQGSDISVQTLENGSIVYFADDPVFRDFWENGKLLISNAAFIVGR